MTKAEKLRKELGVQNREVFVVCDKGCVDPDFEAYFDGNMIMVITQRRAITMVAPADGEEWIRIMLDDHYEVIPADQWNYNARYKEFEEAGLV